MSEPDFAASFNRRSFVFAHELHTRPLYELDSLVALAERHGPERAYWSTRPAAVADGWEDRRAPERSLVEAVREVGQSDTLVVLKDMEGDPVFGPVFQAVLAEMAARVGPALQQDILHGRATLLISSPRRVTAYHIDAEANFLLQLRGSKTVWVYDRAVLSQPELEAFYAGDLNAAAWRDGLPGEAIDFQPGTGVHVPVEWPHWVQNGADISVSISINYDLRSNARRAKLFRANRQLRRAGLSPRPPGAAWDAGKVAAISAWERLRNRAA